MMNKRWLIALAATLSLAGCDRGDQASSTNAPAEPTTEIATVVEDAPRIPPLNTHPSLRVKTPPTTAPAEPTISSIYVHEEGKPDRIYDFPPAKLRLIKEGDRYSAVLYSDDPQSAIKRDYNGNSYFLQMKLDLEDPKLLSEATWQHKAVSSQREESLDGIFLDGQRFQIQPFDADAKFYGNASPVQLVVKGQFMKFDNNDPGNTGVLVGVRGEITATIEVK